MELEGKVCVVTGGASGIGAALVDRFVFEGASVVAVDQAPLPGGSKAVATVRGDVGLLATHARAVAEAEARFGPVDLYCSNAGLLGSTIEAAPERWDELWRVNVLAHALAARVVLPSMLARGSGWLLQTASAAGLLVNLGDPAYTATKHAAVGLAQWLAATYGHRGIGVSCLCPMGVDTPMLAEASEGGTTGAVVKGAGAVLHPEVVADAVVQALREELFLVLPHPEVGGFLTRKWTDLDAWLKDMSRVQEKLERMADG